MSDKRDKSNKGDGDDMRLFDTASSQPVEPQEEPKANEQARVVVSKAVSGPADGRLPKDGKNLGKTGLQSVHIIQTAKSERDRKKDKKKPEVRPEDSIGMRIAAVAMVILLITGASSYIGTPLLFTFMLIWLGMAGTLLSYLFREKRPFWVNILPTCGALGIIAYLIQDCVVRFSGGQPNLLIPFTQALAGFLSLQCFDLRTRADFNIIALIGLGLLVCTSGAAGDWLFIIWILGYVTSLSLMLYFDSVSRSKEVGPSRPLGEGRPASLPKPAVRRQARAATSVLLIPVLSLPIMTMVMFFFMPRSSSLISWVLENVIRPHIAISRTERGKGLSPGGLQSGVTPGANGSPGGSTGGGGSGPGGKGEGGAGKDGVNPLDSRTSGNAPKGVGQGGAGSKYKEGKEEKPAKTEVVPPSDNLEDIVMRINAPRASYTRRMTYDKYDGMSWDRSAPIEEVSFPKDESNLIDVGNANALVVNPDCPIVEVKQQITLDHTLPGGALPAFWVPQTMAGPFDSVTVQADGSLKLDGEMAPGSTYEVLSMLPVYRQKSMHDLPYKKNSEFKRSLFLPPPEEMQAAENELMTKYRQLPDTLPPRLISKAKKIAGDNGNWFVRAERIKDYLSKHCKYKTSDIYRVKDGDFVDNFLFKSREGNCVDFASAFVVMCRAAGIPTRLVGGYLPGKFNKNTGFYEVKVKDGHAWGEVYLPNWGWVPFDSTPIGSLPEFEKSEGFFSKLADMGFANPFGGAFQQSRARPGAGMGKGITGSDLSKKLQEEKMKKEGKDVEDPDAPFDFMKWLSKIGWEPFAIAVIAIITIALSYLFFKQNRAKNTLGIPEDARKSTLLFFQVLRDLRKYKIVRLPTDTPHDLAFRIHDIFEEHRQGGKFVHPELEPLITTFMDVYTTDRFGRSDHVSELETMSLQIKQLVNVQK